MTRADVVLNWLSGLAVLLVASAFVWTRVTGGQASESMSDRIESAFDQIEVDDRTRVGRLDTLSGMPEIVVFSDYECPYCAAFDSALAAHSRSNGPVRVSFRHYPLPAHLNARRAASIAVCAEMKGRLSAVHNRLFQVTWEDTLMAAASLAKESGYTSPEQLQACMKSKTTLTRLRSDFDLSQIVGIRGTPTILTRDAVYYGFVAPDSLF